MLSTGDKLNNTFVQNFFKAIYFIDLIPIIARNRDSVTTVYLEDLVSFGLFLNSPAFDDLGKK